jgi:segregation and condensation protein B
MRKVNPSPPPQDCDPTRNERQRDASPLSLSRLRDAFAAMLSPHVGGVDGQGEPGAIATRGFGDAALIADASDAPTACQSSHAPRSQISPRSIVEAILFVGHPENRAFTARELAAAMRGVTPAEVEAAVVELNMLYDADQAPYHIDGSPSGYQLRLREEFARLRDKFHGRVREATLSPSTVDVLSIVAYRQPVTAEQINQLRGIPSGALLSTLVRRRLVRLERPTDKESEPTYWTTDRFLRLFGLEELSALPRSEELEKA